MPPKKTPAPIDRPLSKAYLREFSGWSTAFAPGLSEPNSLRRAENVMITDQGAARVRPGMRSIMDTKLPYPIVGSHELFYTAEGERAYLLALREPTKVSFRVLTLDEDETTLEVTPILQTLQEADFELLGDTASVEFTSDTTYVRYLQIDNKIFALSDNPEPMVMFWVGTEKKAKRLTSIERPDWSLEDKARVVHPDASWITDATILSRRINRIRNPAFEKSMVRWKAEQSLGNCKAWRSSSASWEGTHCLVITAQPERENLAPYSLSNVSLYGIGNGTTTGIGGWGRPGNTDTSWNGCYRIEANGDSMRIYVESRGRTTTSTAYNYFPVRGGQRLRLAMDYTAASNVKDFVFLVRFYNSKGEQLDHAGWVGGTRLPSSPARCYSNGFDVPPHATHCHIYVGAKANVTDGRTTYIDVKNVYLGADAGIASGDLAPLSGDDGTDYFWRGTPGASAAVYQPPQTVVANHDWVYGEGGKPYIGSAYVRTNDIEGLDVNIRVRARNSAGTVTYQNLTGQTTEVWQRFDSGVFTVPDDTVQINLQVIIRDMPFGTGHVNAAIDGVLLEESATLESFFHGGYPPSTEFQRQTWDDTEGGPHNARSYSDEITRTYNPGAEGPTENTLVSSDPLENVYNFGFFYTISNEIGESAPSMVTTIKTQRPWSAWSWGEPDFNGEPTSVIADDPSTCADQLNMAIPESVFNAAVAAGAIKWNAYFYTWGPNDAPPVTAIKFDEIALDASPVFGVDSWARLSPEQIAVNELSPLIPTEKSRFNASDPSRGSQGIVAADRLILVGDPEEPARISWSSGETGNYYDFSSALGGGTKTLTSGNLFVTACVKLWQNPQSVDTLTVLNRGDEGRSSAYYMQPAQITSLSESINVMGFEQTTGMEGTSSPYGCEVVNNALYHPLKQYIIKSTANNYNLSHKTVTDTIENMWQELVHHHHIVSSHLEGRIYYLVHNRFGELLENNCRGNEIWVLDIRSKEPVWYRWMVQGVSLRTMLYNNKVVMSLTRPDGLFVFDPRRSDDEYFAAADGALSKRYIKWRLETNTQGANRAHDAWCNLQQANVQLANFHGQMSIGIRGKDLHGADVDIGKTIVGTAPPPPEPPADDDPSSLSSYLVPHDLHDFFLIRKMMKEWVFYAHSVNDIVEEQTDPEIPELVEVERARYCTGQVNMVQYRYTPVSVNVGYEYGSVETFEYGSSALAGTTTDSGTPQPFIDTSGQERVLP